MKVRKMRNVAMLHIISAQRDTVQRSACQHEAAAPLDRTDMEVVARRLTSCHHTNTNVKKLFSHKHGWSATVR
jgi:hypothetical protein